MTDACFKMGQLFTATCSSASSGQSAEAAEFVKVYENTSRMINIALADDWAQVCDKLDDLRESAAPDVIRRRLLNGAEVVYHDTYCPAIHDDGHTEIRGRPMASVALDAASV